MTNYSSHFASFAAKQCLPLYTREILPTPDYHVQIQSKPKTEYEKHLEIQKTEYSTKEKNLTSHSSSICTIYGKKKKKYYWTYNMISTLAGLIYLSGEISNIVRNM
jgi:hypothetical protein